MAGTGSYITPRLTQAGQINITPNSEPRSLSDIINFTQKSNLVESQIPFTSLTQSQQWAAALGIMNRNAGISQIYNEACQRFSCPGGAPISEDAQTATVGVTLPVGIAVNNVTNRVYVTGQNVTSVFDGTSNALIATVHVGAFPQGIAVNTIDNYAYVANSGSGSITVIFGNNGALNLTIGNSPTDVAFNPHNRLVYVTSKSTNSVTFFNGTAFTSPVTLSSGFMTPSSVSVDPGLNRVYITNSGSNYVSVINSATNIVVKNVTVGPNPTAVAVNPITHRAYVANNGGFCTGTVSVIDEPTNTTLTPPISVA